MEDKEKEEKTKQEIGTERLANFLNKSAQNTESRSTIKRILENPDLLKELLNQIGPEWMKTAKEEGVEIFVDAKFSEEMIKDERQEFPYVLVNSIQRRESDGSVRRIPCIRYVIQRQLEKDMQEIDTNLLRKKAADLSERD